MTLDEFKAKQAADEEWAPGWDAIDGVFDALYPDQEPKHFASNMASRAIFGGNEFLDGYSIYESPNGYKHLVTYGMSELYAEEKSFGGEFSKWGYEMTFKLKEDSIEDCMWAIDVLSNMARYTYRTERWFEPYHYVAGNGTSIRLDKPECKITALMVVADTEAEGLDTIYGRLDFIQFVGITTEEINALKEGKISAEKLAKRIKADYPNLETDMNRTHSYV